MLKSTAQRWRWLLRLVAMQKVRPIKPQRSSPPRRYSSLRGLCVGNTDGLPNITEEDVFQHLIAKHSTSVMELGAYKAIRDAEVYVRVVG